MQFLHASTLLLLDGITSVRTAGANGEAGAKSMAQERHLDPCQLLMGDARKSRLGKEPAFDAPPKDLGQKWALLPFGLLVAETRSPSNIALI